MRLQSKEIQTILRVAKDIYGDGVKVYLFGSRLDDKKRGGDIDLLIRTEKRGIGSYSYDFQTKILFGRTENRCHRRL